MVIVEGQLTMLYVAVHFTPMCIIKWCTSIVVCISVFIYANDI